MHNQQLIPATLLAFTVLASAPAPAAAAEVGKCPLKQLAQLNLRVDDSAVLVPVTQLALLPPLELGGVSRRWSWVVA
jgi:hypothetical protein